MVACVESSMTIFVVALVVPTMSAVPQSSSMPLPPLAVTPPLTPEGLSEWSEDLTDTGEELQERCGQVAREMKSFRTDSSMGGGSLPVGIGLDEAAQSTSAENASRVPDLLRLTHVLGGLKDLESYVRVFLFAMRSAEGLVRNATCSEDNSTQANLTLMPGKRDRLLVCLLGVVGKARALLGDDDAIVSWTAVESLVVAEAQSSASSPDVRFGLGLYWSDIGLARNDAAGSSDVWWVKDHGSASAPPHIVRAESLLQEAQAATQSAAERKNRAATRALRLYQHADFMARKQHVAAAVWRYQAAAKLASASRRSRLPMHGLEMHALTRLAYFLDRSGKDAEALAAATAAVAIEHTSATSRIPLAKYLQVTIRRRLGLLQTEQELFDAEEQLLAVEGQLPSATLENERAVAHAEFVAWRRIAEAPAWSILRVQRCLHLGDGARVMICLLTSIVFA